jgi:hypothetical protein
VKEQQQLLLASGCCSSLKEEEGRLEIAPRPFSSTFRKKKKPVGSLFFFSNRFGDPV